MEAMPVLQEVVQSIREYERIYFATCKNEEIAEYYRIMAGIESSFGDKAQAELLLRKAENIERCHKVMHFNHYVKASVKDFRGTDYCHDRFCPICAKLAANSREQKFDELLTATVEQYDMYHMVLTCPNVEGEGLRATVKRMSKAYRTLMRYFQGFARCGAFAFESLGFVGAIRSLEITFRENRDYHPHYHTIVAVRKDIVFGGENYNDFSQNYNSTVLRVFSDFEIVLQKIWRLLLSGQKVTKSAVAVLDQGYSVTFDKIEDNRWHQAFKYAVKSEADVLFDFQTFQDLYTSLRGMRSIQCYGIFMGHKLEAETIEDADSDQYDDLVHALNAYEYPWPVMESALDVRENMLKRKCVYISRKSIRSYIIEKGLDDDVKIIVHFIVPDKSPPLQLCIDFSVCGVVFND